MRDPDTGDWISDAEVAEIAYTAFASTPHPVTARLIVRRVKDARYPDALFPVWRYHPFFTNTDDPTAAADITHRRHAIIETVFADLIDGPLAHLPSGRFGANSAWILCAAIAHNLLRAAGVLAGGTHAVARGATLRRRIVTIPARLARPQRRPVLHLPRHWPWTHHWLTLWRNTIGTAHRAHRDPLTTRRKARPETHRKSWADQQTPCPPPETATTPPTQTSPTAHRWIKAKRNTVQLRDRAVQYDGAAEWLGQARVGSSSVGFGVGGVADQGFPSGCCRCGGRRSWADGATAAGVAGAGGDLFCDWDGAAFRGLL